MKQKEETNAGPYRGRIAPTPSGYLHPGHGRTFRVAMERAHKAEGVLVYRTEDLDQSRCRPKYLEAAMQDLRGFGLSWEEGPDVGGPFGPYIQSQRMNHYLAAWQKLHASGYIYPCSCSRKDVRNALSAPHADDPVFPSELRPPPGTGSDAVSPGATNWRFRVPDERALSFEDGRCGPQSFVAGQVFGDFLVWRKDGFPSYELAVVADDVAMRITEVVRGEDLLKSTARQILIYESLGVEAPDFYHCELMLDAEGKRLAKRDGVTRLTEHDAGG
ncbi:MAG: tRNA glutamyl-Q synthetase [Opitutales bacterium]|nr:tRNA glutamyl-Q synthetase [Opitutales bacterium]